VDPLSHWARYEPQLMKKIEGSSNAHGYQLAGKETTHSATFMSSASAQVIIKPNKKE